jgi:hypothetical protein
MMNRERSAPCGLAPRAIAAAFQSLLCSLFTVHYSRILQRSPFTVHYSRALHRSQGYHA